MRGKQNKSVESIDMDLNIECVPFTLNANIHQSKRDTLIVYKGALILFKTKSRNVYFDQLKKRDISCSNIILNRISNLWHYSASMQASWVLHAKSSILCFFSRVIFFPRKLHLVGTDQEDDHWGILKEGPFRPGTNENPSVGLWCFLSFMLLNKNKPPLIDGWDSLCHLKWL